jgi:hypothetical protein
MSRPLIGNPTCIRPINTLITSLNKINSNVMDIAGGAGSYIDSYFNITPSNMFYDCDGYNSALVVVSDWEWFDQLTNYTTTIFNNTLILG